MVCRLEQRREEIVVVVSYFGPSCTCFISMSVVKGYEGNSYNKIEIQLYYYDYRLSYVYIS